MTAVARSILAQFESALGTGSSEVDLAGGRSLPSIFAVSDLAQASVASAAGALGALISTRTGRPGPDITVHRQLASAWFMNSIRPEGWTLPAPWDAI